MDSAQWTQEFGVTKSMGEIVAPTNTTMDKKVRPQKDQALNCPRCHSTNTKFCYFNNYSLTQPRYFCKTCRRYWTEGGTLRNVPVGGGSRRNKKSTSMMTTPHHHHKLPDLNPSPSISQNPKIHDQVQDLNLGFRVPHDHYQHGIPQFLDFPKTETREVINPSSSSSSSATALNFLRNPFVPMAHTTLENNAIFASAGYPFQECKPSLSFPIIGNPHENNNGFSQMFTLGAAARRNSSTSDQADDQNKGQENTNGFWNGMLGGGGSW